MGKRANDGPSSNANDQQQKRAKRYGQIKDRYRKPANAFELSPGMKGFFVTCTRGREMKSARETIDLLETYAAKLYPDLFAAEPGASTEDAALDIEDEIARELSAIREKDDKPNKEHKFRVIQTAIDCLVFIKCTREIDPQDLVRCIFEDLVKTKDRRTRFTSRLIPAQITCAAKPDAVVKAAIELGKDLLADDAEPTTFALAIKSRYCDEIKRDDLIPLVAAPFDKKHKVDIKNAKFTFVIEAFKSICILGLVEDYGRLKKLNLQTIADI